MAWSQFKTAVVVGGILLLAGTTASVVISQTQKPDSASSQRKVQMMPDRTTPKGTLLVMINAMKAGDGKACVESYVFANADELKLKATLENVVNACAKFRQAIGKQFGPEAEEEIAANLPLVMPSEVIESATEKITGDSAELTLAGGKSGRPAQFKRVDGEWKMTAEGLIHLSPAVQDDMFSRLVSSLNETTPEIPQGKFKTADKAMSKMKERAR